MRRQRTTAILFLCALLFFPIAAWAEGPRRIVSLKPSITDVVFALGAGPRLVGVTKYCDIPPGVPRPAVAGDYTQPYLERIIALAPDLVLGSRENSSRRSIEQLQRMGIRVELFPFTTVAEMLTSIRAIGVALGMAKEGEDLAKRTEDELSVLKKRWGMAPPMRTIVVWGLRPLIVAGRGTYLDELLGIIGAENAVKETRIRYPRLGLEEFIALDPDAIVDLSMGSEKEKPGAREQGSGKPWDGVTTLKAVREGHIIALDASFFRAGPRLPEGLALLGRMLHTTSDRPIVRSSDR